ncbi:TonB-dependent receptor [Pseudocnuella soli]|uniref:TonB-dependent receptor n=1 Tax=Pseudocnuella soli TaxID=2502779 RepID=UPI00104CD02C|nr:carboxypeptidase-like regulatory domain-containing protein [Pseudocnuella soli]
MKPLLRHSILLLLLLCSGVLLAQKNTAFVQGKVVNEEGQPLAAVSVTILGQQKGIATSDSGIFRIRATAGRAFALIFSYTGYKIVQQNFMLLEGEEESVTVQLERMGTTLGGVVVRGQQPRTETGLIRIDGGNISNLPAPVSGVESLIKIFVGANNELTSQYTVRGGSYDENLIYVNDFEIFRPYLVRNGQQEGLSFINPALVRNLNFYNGGFSARYGDKMSSVLDIQYNKPQHFGGSANISLLEQGLHFEGLSRDKKFSYVIGARNRDNRNLLRNQATEGIYLPSSSDIQALLTYQFSPQWQAEVLGNISATRFTFYPSYTQLSSSVVTPYLTANIAADIFFEGSEKSAYSTQMLGIAATNQRRNNVRLKWLVSGFRNKEAENIDIAGTYLFGDRDFDKSQPTFGTIINPLGSGAFQNWSRNNLDIANYNFSHKGQWQRGRRQLLWGAGYDRTQINDQLYEWEMQDSAGYSLPFQPGQLNMKRFVRSAADIGINKFNGYLQHGWLFGDSVNAFTLQTGLRVAYNDLNGEILISPRINASWKPGWRRDVMFRAAAGAYHQPPFYRELRRMDGSVNKDLKAQKSWQGVLGMDYQFIGFGRPMRLTAEGYYKYLTDVVPYDIDNVRVRYFGENTAKAYAAGLDLRLHGELVKDAESWISVSLMRTRENLEGDVFKRYTLDSLNQPIDSTIGEAGWLRRPTDRLITFGMFFQDYLANNKNFKVYLSTLYGTNLPYNIPGSVANRNALTIPPYIRVDIGFSALLLNTDKSARRSHHPFRNLDNIWLALEVFNLIDRSNTISYQLIKDFANNTFAMPNRLTPRLLNLKLTTRW